MHWNRSACLFRLLTVCVAMMLVLTQGCGKGQKIRLTNATGAAMSQLYVRCSAGEESWTELGNGQSVSTRMTLAGGETITVGWTSGLSSVVREIQMVDNVDEASEIEVTLEGDVEKLRIGF